MPRPLRRSRHPRRNHLLGKKELRQQFRDLRRAFGAAARLDASLAAASFAHAWIRGRGARRVALFVSLADEIDTEPLFRRLRGDTIEVALPRVRVADTSLDFVVTDDLNDLVPGPFRLLEPVGSAVPLASIDIVVVPGLAFDMSGARLGYGAGYYDRALASFTGTTLGYCYAFQLTKDPLPIDSHDRHVSAVAHSAGVHECR